ncbi:hypothetical protein AXY43_15925 [Clostridium sp. MF28]|nr:hypothetical protein AXY43_15925 [Clostridium sp. MF28]PSM58017.1 hypothetical protein C4L39_09390 [Clostridium diolis]
MKNKIVGFIGTGYMGFEEAKAVVNAGYQVIVSNSREPETLKDKVAELGENACAATPTEVAQKADIVMIALPYRHFDKLPMNDLKNKISVLISNYDYSGTVQEIDNNKVSFAQYIQEKNPDVRWVRGLNNLNSGVFMSLIRPEGDSERSALPVASDDRDALLQVAELIRNIGFDTIELDSLKESWRFEPMTPAFLFPYLNDPESLMKFMSNLNGSYQAPPYDSGRTVTVSELEALLTKAEK